VSFEFCAEMQCRGLDGVAKKWHSNIVSEESEETSSSDGEDPDYGHDEIGFSQIPNAPEPTQDTPRPKRRTRARARDHTDVGSANVLATKPGRPRRPKKPFTPHPSHD